MMHDPTSIQRSYVMHNKFITKITSFGPIFRVIMRSVHYNPCKKLYNLINCIESIMGCGMQVINYNNAPCSFPSPFDWLRQF